MSKNRSAAFRLQQRPNLPTRQKMLVTAARTWLLQPEGCAPMPLSLPPSLSTSSSLHVMPCLRLILRTRPTEAVPTPTYS